MLVLFTHKKNTPIFPYRYEKKICIKAIKTFTQTSEYHIGPMVLPFVQEGKMQGPTYPRLIDANIKCIDKVFQEHADQPEVEPTNTPGPVHQDHDICNGLSVAHKLIG